MRSSMFDPFKDQIRKWCEAGVPVKEQAQLLGEGYNRQSLYSYIHTRNLWDDPYSTIYDNRNHCSECEYCHRFKNNMGRYTKADKICSLSWQVINWDVKCCPIWCEKGAKNDNSKTL